MLATTQRCLQTLIVKRRFWLRVKHKVIQLMQKHVFVTTLVELCFEIITTVIERGRTNDSLLSANRSCGTIFSQSKFRLDSLCNRRWSAFAANNLLLCVFLDLIKWNKYQVDELSNGWSELTENLRYAFRVQELGFQLSQFSTKFNSHSGWEGFDKDSFAFKQLLQCFRGFLR